MLTFKYKGCWIHNSFKAGAEVVVQFSDYTFRRVRSVHAAKCLITRKQ